MPGPPPKRSDERRRRNTPESGNPQVVDMKDDPMFAGRVDPPPANENWHAVAKSWYESLATSGQRVFYEPSDWATAYLTAESMSRDLEEQFVGIHEKTGEVIKAKVPLKGASLTAYSRIMAVLMVNEGDRRRVGLELKRESIKESRPLAVVASFEEAAAMRAGQTG